MNTIKDIQDPSVRKLAETLKQSGLAASETEAIRMASNMSNTNSKVNQVFEERRGKTVMGLSHLNKEAPKQSAEPQTEESENRPEQSLKNTENHSPAQSPADYEDSDPSEQVIKQEIVEQPHEEPAIQEQKEKPVQEEVKVEEPAPSQEETQPEHSKPSPSVQTPEKAPAKKNIAEMAESKVDLGEVFKFSA